MADEKPEYGPGQEPTVGKSAAHQRREYIEALKVERQGYMQRGLTDRVEHVDAVIRQLTGEAKPAPKARRTSAASGD